MCAKIAIEKMSGAIVRSRKGRMDMATMTRFYGLYEKCYESRFEEDFGRGMVLHVRGPLTLYEAGGLLFYSVSSTDRASDF